MTGEGLVGLIAGLQEQSVSLLGWAIGSGTEGLASVIVIWRFTGTRTLSETATGRAQKAAAVSFFLLAPIWQSREYMSCSAAIRPAQP